MERPADFKWNQWPESRGIGGRLQMESVAGLDWNTQVIEDALELGAFSCEYIANLLEQRKRINAPVGALHLTRSEDLLELEIEQPDMNLYEQRSVQP